MKIEARTQKIAVYVTADGKEFDTEQKAREHEENIQRQILKEYWLNEQIRELEGQSPLNSEGLPVGDNDYYWFEVKDNAEMKEIQDVFNCDNKTNFITGFNYPEIICIEQSWGDEGWVYYLSEIMADTKDFWKKFGYNVKFEKRKE